MNDDHEVAAELFDALIQFRPVDDLPIEVVIDCYIRATCCAAGFVYDDEFLDAITRLFMAKMDRQLWKRFSGC